MGLRTRIALLLCLAAAAIYTGGEALKRLEPAQTELPEEIYSAYAANEKQAEYFLKTREGYVAVYTGKRASELSDVTQIEVDGLRTADKAMLEKGIPVVSRTELLTLLEDLGS